MIERQQQRADRGRPLKYGQCLLFLSSVVCLLSSVGTVAAQAAAPFYKGKTIRIVISTGVAGGSAEYARLLADHMGAHIAGRPGPIRQSMPGAGALMANTTLYTQAPQG